MLTDKYREREELNNEDRSRLCDTVIVTDTENYRLWLHFNLERKYSFFFLFFNSKYNIRHYCNTPSCVQTLKYPVVHNIY